jgi:uncharacterized protein (TIGR03435 family)
MKQVLARLGFFALLSGAAWAQATAFEIADVHVSPKTLTPRMSGGVLRGARFEMRQATMVDLVRVAYGVDADKVLGGPSWLEVDRFDVFAKAPASTSPETVKLMLQTLLADRFKLVVREDSKPMPAFVLVMGKGKPKLKEADGSGDPGCRPQPQTAPPEPGVIPLNLFVCRSVTMETFVQLLHNFANGYLTSPTVDATDLKGAWDFELRWTSRGVLLQAGADGISLFDAVDKQLGLKLEPQQVPMPVIQVASVNRAPTENPPGITTKLPPPPPAEFEVADIRPTAPGATGARLQLLPTGRLDGQNIPLKTYISLAWNINNDELMAGLPKFAENARFDIVAKMSTTAGPADNAQIDVDSLRLMLQKVLIDRFKLAVHMEDRPVSGYVLTAVKPKLQKADPSGRTGCSSPPPGSADAKDPRLTNPVLSQYLICRNMTIAQLGEQLAIFANGYVQTPVLDSTGLTDAYDFTLSWSAIGLVRNGGVPGQPAPAGAAGAAPSDPNGALPLPDAVLKQLGLKMELQKRPLPVLVIDHLEEKPTDN